MPGLLDTIAGYCSSALIPTAQSRSCMALSGGKRPCLGVPSALGRRHRLGRRPADRWRARSARAATVASVPCRHEGAAVLGSDVGSDRGPIVLRNDWFLAALGVLAGVLLPIAVFAIFRVQYRWKVQNQLPDAFFLIAR